MLRNPLLIPGLAFLGALAIPGCAGAPATALQGDWLGQPPPGLAPRLFAPGVVCTPDAVELNGVFSPDGCEFFFTRTTVRPGGGEGVSRMHRCRRDRSGRWSPPEHVQVWPGDATSLAVDMTYANDGNRLYFLGRHPHERAPEQPGYDLWVSERTATGGWSLATPLPPPIWTEHVESYPAILPDGGLLFASNRPGGHGRFDLWRAAPKSGGGFDTPVNLGPRINSSQGEGDACMAPDGSYLVFTTERPGDQGNGDLYVSFLDPASQQWSEPVPLGHGVNSADTDYCPMVTADGRYLFFSRRISDPKDGGWDTVVAGDVYWVSTQVVEALRP